MVLLTGASGFVGAALVRRLAGLRAVRAVVHSGKPRPPMSGAAEWVEGDVSVEQDWSQALAGIDCVIHCAARVHVMNDMAFDPLAEFRRTNVDGTMRLAQQAAESKVRRFVFISSIKVNGEWTDNRSPFVADEVPDPQDPYGVSKMEAERGLRKLAEEAGMEVVIVRPPLVYGPGVKANFLAMMNWLARGVPLPLGAIHNVRSLVSIDNLIDLVVTCIEHPAAANQVFLVSDGEDLSTTDLLLRMGRALGKPALLFPVPQQLLTFGARVLGRPGMVQRLCGSLQVDITKTRETLDWHPPVSVEEGLRRTAAYWRATHA